MAERWRYIERTLQRRGAKRRCRVQGSWLRRVDHWRGPESR